MACMRGDRPWATVGPVSQPITRTQPAVEPSNSIVKLSSLERQLLAYRSPQLQYNEGGRAGRQDAEESMKPDIGPCLPVLDMSMAYKLD